MLTADILIRAVMFNDDGTFTYRIMGYILDPFGNPNGEFLATRVDEATANSFVVGNTYSSSVTV